MAAIGAADEPTQRKILTEVSARRNTGAALKAVLNAHEGLKADEANVARRTQLNVPRGHRDIARIERLGQEVLDPLVDDFAFAVLRIDRVGFEEALHFRLRTEPLGGIALKCFAHDGGDRLISYEHLALRGALVAIPDWRGVTPKPIEHTPAHAVLGLLAVLLALMLRDAGQQVLDELAIAAIAKLD